MKLHTEFLSVDAFTAEKKKKRLIRRIFQGYRHRETGNSPAEGKSNDYNMRSQI